MSPCSLEKFINELDKLLRKINNKPLLRITSQFGLNTANLKILCQRFEKERKCPFISTSSKGNFLKRSMYAKKKREKLTKVFDRKMRERF